MSRPATTNAMNGTMSGPGAMASPDRSADQPQAPCSHSTIERSMAPNEAEKKMATSDAPVKLPGPEQRRVDERSAAAQAVQDEERDERRRRGEVPTMAG